MDNELLNEVLEIARNEWNGTVARSGDMFIFKTVRLGDKIGINLKVSLDEISQSIRVDAKTIWYWLELRLERHMYNYALNRVFYRTIDQRRIDTR